MPGDPHPHSKHNGLVRGLGLWAATAIVIGDTIGTGVFLVSSDMARIAGSPALVIAAWILGGVVVLFGAFCYAELGAAFPKSGGPFVYLGRALGPLWGFLFGWMSSFLDRPVAMAGLAAGFIRFLSFFFPVVATPLFTRHIGSYEFNFATAQPLAALVVVIVTGVNYFSVRLSGAIQVLMTALKILTVLLIIVGGLLFGATHAAQPIALGGSIGLGTFGALLTALVPAMWAYNGFNDLGDLGEEIKEPGKNIPRSILLGLAVVGTLYLPCELHLFPRVAFLHRCNVPSHCLRCRAVLCRITRRRVDNDRNGSVCSRSSARSCADRCAHSIRDGARRCFLSIRGAPPSFDACPHRFASLPGHSRHSACSDGHIRGALLSLRICGLDFFCPYCNRPTSFTPHRTRAATSVPRVGLPDHAADLPARSRCSHGEFMDGPPGSVFHRFARYPLRNSLLLSMAKSRHRPLEIGHPQNVQKRDSSPPREPAKIAQRDRIHP